MMIHGVGCQLVQWAPSLIQGLVDAGFRVVTMDNRDVGLSFFHSAPAPSLDTLLDAMDVPEALEPAYSLADMAGDVCDLLDHIGQSGAHVVGVSMGGMIAQRLAIHHPQRVFSLTSVMSHTGNRDLPKPSMDAVQALATSVMQTTRESYIETAIHANRVLGGPHYDSREVGTGRFIELAYDRCHRSDGTSRQFAAILVEPDRRPELRTMDIPVLAIHGSEDRLVHPSGSEDLISNVPDGRLELLPRVGHDLPEPLIAHIVETIATHCHRSMAQR